ncbi:glycosyltransferase [Acetobacter senegalensis]|uniref:glycosyltransferase n=1 Tax=Acetobacter senegalensis TaxID=446692 RepID=UPI001EDA63B3|nr:glycosyltransferase [Acetobacter senegalensis]MCG4272925.1 glycosyltransferase [Acetobacter senegalensis]
MIRFSNFHSHIRKIPLSVPAHIRDEDVGRLEHSWFGPRFCSQKRNGVGLFVGGRSGLECLLHLHYAPEASVYVVEPDFFLRASLTGLFGTDPRVSIYESLDAFLAAAKDVETLDFVRIDDAYYPTVWTLIKHFKIKALTTEIPFSCSIYDISEQLRSHVSFLYLAHASGRGRGFDKPQPKIAVSVIVPAYGVAAQLPQCLDSLVEQTLERLEIIVVDDGSPDACGEIADSYAQKFPERVVVVHKANGGCASARNAGMAVARGQFIGFVDGDDWVAPDMYSDLYKMAVENAADVAQGGYCLAYEGGLIANSNDIYAGRDGLFKRSGIVDNPLSLLTGQPTIWRRIYAKELLTENKIIFPEHIKRFDDLPFQFEALSLARRIVTTAKDYYYYRQGRLGQDILAKDEKLFVHFDIFDYLKPRVTSRMRNDVIEQLMMVEVNTHIWALGRLDSNLVEDYKARAMRSLHDGYKMLAPKARRKIMEKVNTEIEKASRH